MEPEDPKKSPKTETADTIVIKRLVRSLQYRLTYLHILDTYLDSDQASVLVYLLMSLLEDQRFAIELLVSYLGRLGVDVQDQPMNQKLVEHASKRRDTNTQLRFIHYGLSRAVSWYSMQMVDRQMTADPDLQKMLTELGEAEAAALWRTGTVMAMLGIPTEPEPEGQSILRRRRLQRADDWHASLQEDVGRPSWKGSLSVMLSGASRSGGRN